jgi:hypothetical protein
VSTKYFNVKNGMTTGDLLVSESNVTLGNVSNLHISGGNSGYLLSTDGAGNLSWADASSTQSPAPMPITIDDGNTLTISANYQGLFGTPITVDGSNSQISFNDNGSPGALNGFTINKVSGNLSVPGSVNAGAFLSLAAYSSATLRGIAGTIGQIAVLNDSSPIGMLAFWDQSNSRWCYVYNNSPV